MSTIKNIKTKINYVSNMKQMVDSIEVSTGDVLKKTKEQIDSYKNFMSDFFSIVGAVDLKNKGLSTNNDGKKLLVVMSVDKGLSSCNKLFGQMLDKIGDQKENIDIYCVGKKSFEYFVKEGYNVVGYFNLTDGFSQDDLKDIYDYLVSNFMEDKYSDISVYFNCVKAKKNVSSKKYNLYPLDQQSLESFVYDMGLNNTSNELQGMVDVQDPGFIKEMEAQLMQHVFYGAALQNKVAELTTRVSLMQHVKNNADFVVKDLILSFNKLRQSLLTREVSNIMSLKMAY